MTQEEHDKKVPEVAVNRAATEDKEAIEAGEAPELADIGEKLMAGIKHPVKHTWFTK